MTKRIKLEGGWPQCVDRTQLEISYYRGSGAGGQKRNKTSSAVMIKHIPTGLYSKCEAHREQSKNKAEAFRKLAEQLVPLMKKEVKKERYSSGTEQVRSYREKDDLVVDERLDKTYSYKEILDGKGLNDLLEDLILNNKNQVN